MAITPLRSNPGGTRTWSRLSGAAGGAAVIQGSGGGWVESITLHPPAAAAAGMAASGAAVPVILFDSNVAGSGSPFPTSGLTILANLQAADPASVASIIFNSGLPHVGRTVKLGLRYNSGLCINGMSGQAGVTISYTPDLNY